MPRTFLSLGSNLGDRAANLRVALARLAPAGIRVARLSLLYETEPQDVRTQPWFLNQVAECETGIHPLTLLRRLHSIERAGGRLRTNDLRRGPRLLDLDVLLYADLVFSTKRLTIPHPRLHQRRFVLQPLLELDRYLIHPITQIPLAQYLSQVMDQDLEVYKPRNV